MERKRFRLGHFYERKGRKSTLLKILALLLAIILMNLFLAPSQSIAKKKFGKTLPISINISSKWDYQPGNHRIRGNYKATITGTANLIKEKGEFLRYSSENLTVSYEYKEDHIEMHTGDPCFGKVVEQNSGSGDAKLKTFLVDVFLGRTGRFTWVASQGKAPTPEELKAPKDVYQVSMVAEGKYTAKTKSDIGCDLKYRLSGIFPNSFAVAIAEINQGRMTGNYTWQGDRNYRDENVSFGVSSPKPSDPAHYHVSWTFGSIEGTQEKPPVEPLKPVQAMPSIKPQEPIQTAPSAKCCIAGKYEGVSVDDPKCPVGPRTGKFILVLKQTRCGSQVKGDIIGPKSGAVTSKFRGTVTSSSDDCCVIVGRSKGVPGGPDEKCVHDVRATLCQDRLGKWYTDDGVYKDLSGSCCSGTFKMKQQ